MPNALLLLAAAAVLEQQPVPLRVETNLVELEVVVTDSKGRPVAELPKEAFRVREDGVTQRVEVFRFERRARRPERTAPAAGVSATTEAAPLSRRYTVWAVDHFNTAPGDSYQVHQALRRFLQGGLAEGESVALASVGRGVRLVQGFTSSAAELERGIARLEGETLSRGAIQPNVGGLLGEMNQCFQLAPSPRRGRAAGGGDDDPRYQCALAAAKSFALQEKEKTIQSLFGYRALASILAGLNGTKRVVLFSGGFQIMPGEIAYKSLAVYFPQLADRARPILVDIETGRLQDVISSSTRGNVTFYCVDARGLFVSIPGGDASEPGIAQVTNPMGVSELARARESGPQDALHALASDTGGLFLSNSNDLAGLMQRAYQHGLESYVLGYYSTNGRLDGKFRRIEVDLPETPYRCRTRSGYFARPIGVIPASIDFGPREAPAAGGLLEVSYRVRLEGSAIRFEGRGDDRGAVLSVQGRIYSRARGTLLTEFVDLFAPKLSKSAKPSEGVVYENRVRGTPGSYRLVLHFRDVSTGSIGSLDETIELSPRDGITAEQSFDAAVREGLEAYRAGRFQDAVALFSSAVELGPTSTPARMNLAVAHLAAGAIDAAERELDLVLAADPKSVAARLVLAGLRLHQGRAREAREAADAAVRLAPGDGAAWFLLGRAAEEQGAGDEASAAYRRSLELAPERWETYFQLAKLLAEKLGRPQEAIAVLEGYLALGGPEQAAARRALEMLRKKP